MACSLGPKLKKLGNGSLEGGVRVRVPGLRLRDMTPVMENQMEKNMENEMETGAI